MSAIVGLLGNVLRTDRSQRSKRSLIMEGTAAQLEHHCVGGWEQQFKDACLGTALWKSTIGDAPLAVWIDWLGLGADFHGESLREWY